MNDTVEKMRQSKNALSDLFEKIESLQKSRPNDLDSPPEGLSSLSYENLKEMLRGWRTLIETFANSATPGDADELFDDRILAGKISLVSQSIASEGQPNGVPWMLAHGTFIERIGNVSEYLALIATRRIAISRALAKELAKETLQNSALILQAAPLVEGFNKKFAEIKASLEDLESKSEETQSRLNSANESSSSFENLKTSAEEAEKNILDRQAEVERYHAEALSFRNKAEEEAARFESRLGEIEEKSEKANDVLDQAKESLLAALSDVKRTGLAGAFTARASAIRVEKYVWLGVFLAALGSLVWLAIVFATQLTSYTYESLIVALLRRVSLAAPAVWAGWYAARQVSRLNLIQEDYEYKVATALAFESYSNEIEDAGDADLLKELLKTTIKNFGDNPVRLQGLPEHEPVTPTQELLTKLDSDGTLTLLQRLRALVSG